jgi:tyrosine-protein kinase Etk/Wzc
MRPISPLDSSREDSIDMKKLINKLRPYWLIFLVSTFVGLTTAHMINTFKEPVYQVSSSLLIHEEHSAVPFLHSMDLLGARSNIFNESLVLESYTLIDSALQNIEAGVSYYENRRAFGFPRRREIYMDAPFRVVFDKDHPQPFEKPITITILNAFRYELSTSKGPRDLNTKEQYFFGEEVKGKHHSFEIHMDVPFDGDVHEDSDYEFIINNQARLPEIYRKDLTIKPLFMEASIFEVTFEATHMRRAQDFVNMLTNTFIQRNLEGKNYIAQNTITFIENQIAHTAGVLATTEGRLQNFREKEQMLDISLVATQLVEELQVLDKERSIEEVKQSYYEFLLEYVSDARDFSEVFGPSTLGIEDPILNNLILELSRLHTERGRLLLTTTERSPSVQAVDQNIKQVKATLAENIRNIQAASRIMMDDLNNRITRLESRISQLPKTERELLGLQRMFNITDATYNFLLEKQAEAGIALASNMPDHKVIDQARFVYTVSPKKNLNYALGLILSLGLPFAFIILRPIFNTRIINKEEVSKALDFPIIGFIPRHKPLIKSDNIEIVIFDHPYSPLTESFRNIRSNLNFFLSRKQNKIIVVTSTRAGEGKTFTSINLAAVLAMSDKPTLYIDADIRKEHPNKFTSHMIDVGLSNYLIGRASLDDIINPSGFNDNLYIMNSGIKSPNPAELIEGPVMHRLLTEELDRFEYVIVDTSPVGMVADAKALMAEARLNLFLVRHNYTFHSDLEFIKDYQNQAGLKNIVIAINDIKQSSNGYGYGYGLGYGYGYGKRTKELKLGSVISTVELNLGSVMSTLVKLGSVVSTVVWRNLNSIVSLLKKFYGKVQSNLNKRRKRNIDG